VLGNFHCQHGDDVIPANYTGDLSGETLRIQSLGVRALGGRLRYRGLNVENKTIAAARDGSDVTIPART
jgi:hypothetical protein